jgi:adenylate cyclase
MTEERLNPQPPDMVNGTDIDYRKAYEQIQQQLMAYAHDLAAAYAAQKRMAQYLPSDLRDRITAGSKGPVGERRQVTVLFVDLVNFTKISSQMEVEGVFELINSSFRRLVSHIFKHGGMVDKFLGDGIMAVFGATETREDDAFRAVQAALDMSADIREFSQERLPILGVPIQLHIGINSGQVIAGSVGVDEQLSFTVLGTPVNVAFRLQELAEPGAILVSQNVYEQTKQLFDYRYLGEFDLKGIQEPVHVYHAQHRPQVEETSLLAGIKTVPFVGRKLEMNTLNRLSQNLAQGDGATLVVTGDHGSGKTRLIREWLIGLQNTRVTVWTGESDQLRHHISYSMWRGMSEKVFPASPGDKLLFESSNSTVWANWGGALPPAAVVLAQLYNQPTAKSPTESRAQAFTAIREKIVTWAARAPIVIVVDEWQWVDTISRQLLASLAPLTDRYPVLLCVIAGETEPEDEWHSFLRSQAGEGYERMHVEPLSHGAVAELLKQAVNPDQLAPEVVTALLEQTDGNPLSLVLSLRGLSARYSISARKNREQAMLRASLDLSAIGLSGDVDTIVKTTVDGLPNYLREIADYAAVLGFKFTGRLLHAIIALERPAKDLSDSIAKLSEHGIIEPMVMDNDTFVFRHSKIQEVLYNNLPPNRIKVLHQAIGTHLADLARKGKSVDVELVAYHFLRAGLPPASVPFLVQAAKRSQRQAANQLSVTYHLAALAALDHAHVYQSERLGLEISLANTYMHSHEYDKAVVHYQAAMALCRQDKKLVEIHQLLGRAFAEQGNLTKAWEQMERALELLSHAALPVHSLTRGRVYADCAHLQWRLGNESQADLWAREALAILEGTQEHYGLSISYQTLSHVYAKLGQHSLAAHYAAKATGSLQNRAPEDEG